MLGARRTEESLSPDKQQVESASVRKSGLRIDLLSPKVQLQASNHLSSFFKTGVNIMKRFLLIALISVSALTTGCASIVTGQNQALSVETRASTGDSLSGANCRLMNDKGTWFVVTPGSITVNRSYNDLNVSCSKDGHEAGVATAKSSTKAMAAGNIIFGGVIGAAVDAGTGAAFDYPSLIQVIMGKSIMLGTPPAEEKKQ